MKVRRRWLRVLLWLGGAFLLIAAGIAVYAASGAMDRHLKDIIVSQIAARTTARAELGEFRFSILDLRAELHNFTIHSSEPENSPPFFHAELISADVRADSLLRRKFSLEELRVVKPQVHVRLNKDGTNNIPQPRTKAPPGRPLRERLFAFVVRKVQLEDGDLLINNTRIPLVAEGGDFDFALDYALPGPGRDRYLCQLSWQDLVLVARRYMPFSSDLNVEFAIERDAFEVTQFTWKLPQSEFRGAVRLAGFEKPAWSFRFDGRFSLLDLKQVLRKPNSPGGYVDFKGEGSHAEGELKISAKYSAQEIDMPYRWFHSAGLRSTGTVRVAKRRLEIPDFQAWVLGGQMRGRVEMQFDGMRFRAATRSEGLSVAGILNAVDNRSFPVNTLHWNGMARIEDVTTWRADFQDVASKGTMWWTAEGPLQPGQIPVSARLNYDWSLVNNYVELRDSEIQTPSSRIRMDGTLGGRDSALRAQVNIADLLQWNDFINRLRGEDSEPQYIAGAAEWRGDLSGPLGGPTFRGHVRGRNFAYDELYWDEAEGEMVYSPEVLRLERFTARRGESRAALRYEMALDGWSFRPDSAWELDVDVQRTPAEGLMSLFRWQYPVRGILTTKLRGGGTRADPQISGPFLIEQGQAYGIGFDRGEGHFALRNDELRISRASITKAGGQIRGGFFYAFPDDTLELDATASAIPLQSIEPLQSEQLPLGGELSFVLRGKGPAASPHSEGTVQIAGLQLGKDRIGSFEGRLTTTGRQAQLQLSSSLPSGSLSGKLELTLQGDYPMRGDLTLENVGVDPLITSGLKFTPSGHSAVSGRFFLTGPLRDPRQIEVEADLTRFVLDDQYLRLENDGPLRFVYREEQIRIERAQIRGPDTNLRLSGFASFAGERRVDLRLEGNANLRILANFWPELDARGVAQVNASVQNTIGNPRVTGGVRLQDAAANYAEFPTGLSRVNGDVVFDRNRMVFENLRAEAGGGQLQLSGTVTYGEGPVRYDLNLNARRVRVRYPVGMSWLLGGTLRLAGTREGAALSGRVAVDRLLMADSFDFGTLIVSSREGFSVPSTTSEFLRNLQFDIEAVSAANARIEWSLARFESEAGLRLRGNWERPVFLGHIHLLNGELNFRGSRYRVTRGDINFADPRRINPVIDLEAVTTIQRYEITVNFSGPASNLTLAYRSDPPLPQSDIIALLALGRTGEESQLRAAGGQEVSGGAAALLSEAISSQLGGRIERLFGISRFKVDPFSTSSVGTGTTARITVEQQLTRELTVVYGTDVDSTQQQIIEVQYDVNPGFSIVALRDRNGTFALDIKFKKRFK